MNKRKKRRSGIGLGFVLLGVGGLCLLTELLGVHLAHVTWPFSIIPGPPFFAGMAW